jgi:hypothetical protein
VSGAPGGSSAGPRLKRLTDLTGNSLVSDLAGWSGKTRKILLFNGTRVDLSQTPAFQFILRFSQPDTLTPQRDPFVTQRHRGVFLIFGSQR